METNVEFVVEQESLKGVFAAAGINTRQDIPLCALMVGDVIAFPPPAYFAVRVTHRWFSVGNSQRPACWYVAVEHVENPE